MIGSNAFKLKMNCLLWLAVVSTLACGSLGKGLKYSEFKIYWYDVHVNYSKWMLIAIQPMMTKRKFNTHNFVS